MAYEPKHTTHAAAECRARFDGLQQQRSTSDSTMSKMV